MQTANILVHTYLGQHELTLRPSQLHSLKTSLGIRNLQSASRNIFSIYKLTWKYNIKMNVFIKRNILRNVLRNTVGFQ